MEYSVCARQSNTCMLFSVVLLHDGVREIKFRRQSATHFFFRHEYFISFKQMERESNRTKENNLPQDNNYQEMPLVLSAVCTSTFVLFSDAVLLIAMAQ